MSDSVSFRTQQIVTKSMVLYIANKSEIEDCFGCVQRQGTTPAVGIVRDVAHCDDDNECETTSQREMRSEEPGDAVSSIFALALDVIRL